MAMNENNGTVSAISLNVGQVYQVSSNTSFLNLLLARIPDCKITGFYHPVQLNVEAYREKE